MKKKGKIDHASLKTLGFDSRIKEDMAAEDNVDPEAEISLVKLRQSKEIKNMLES